MKRMDNLYRIDKEILKKCRELGKCPCSLEDKKCPCNNFLNNDECSCGVFIKVNNKK